MFVGAPELQGYLFARKRCGDGLFKRWKPRWYVPGGLSLPECSLTIFCRFIVVKACEDRALGPHTRTIAYFETEAEARQGIVNPKGFVVLTEDATIVNPFEQDPTFGLSLGTSLAIAPVARFFQVQVAHADADSAIIDFCANSVADASRWLVGLRRGIAELSDSAASNSERSLVLAPSEEHLPRAERMRLLIRRSYDKLKTTSMLGKLVKNGSLELVRGGDALVQGRQLISLSGSQRLSLSNGSGLGENTSSPDLTAQMHQSRDAASPSPSTMQQQQQPLTQAPPRIAVDGDAPFHSLQLDRLSPRHVGETSYYLRVHIKRLFADADMSGDLPVWARADHMGVALGSLVVPALRTGFDLEFAYITHQSKSLYGYGDFTAANSPINFAKNRYMDVMPPDRTRVVLAVSAAARAAATGRARLERSEASEIADDSSSSTTDGKDDDGSDSSGEISQDGNVLRASRRDIEQNSSDAEEEPAMLGRDGEDSSGDYINASYIDGEWDGGARAYIAAQGPKEGTIHDFWRMVWQVQSVVVVMLTREFEAGRCKCSHYWPNATASLNSGGDGDPLQMFPTIDAARTFANMSQWRKYGEVEVRALYEIVSNEVIVRRFRLRRRRAGDAPSSTAASAAMAPSLTLDDEDHAVYEHRDVMHFQYVAWPDHGLPLNTRAFLDLVRCVESLRNAAPIILHCSAGIGRTGTFFTVHNTVRRYHERLLAESSHSLPPPINVVQTVLTARRQRPGMVQTREQFMFCYIAIEQWLDEALNALSVRRQDSSEFEHMLRSTSPATARASSVLAVQTHLRRQQLNQQQMQKDSLLRQQNEQMRIIAKQRQLRNAVPSEGGAAVDLAASWRNTSFEALSPEDINDNDGSPLEATAVASKQHVNNNINNNNNHINNKNNTGDNVANGSDDMATDDDEQQQV